MKSKDKLRIKWSKKLEDVEFHYPLGRGTKSDAHYLYGFFNKDFILEMTERGYDITTLKFEISPQVGHTKFSSQREDE